MISGRWALCSWFVVLGCSTGGSGGTQHPSRDASVEAAPIGTPDAVADVRPPDSAASAPDQGPPWAPGMALPSLSAGPRGLLDLRGLIHEHSIHSHDACDNKPRSDAGVFDQACLADFRRGLCDARHDYVMLTDHPTFFVDVEYPEALLYDAARGDVLIERGGSPVANRAACPDGTSTLLLGGTEASSPNFMPVGLERHVAGDPAARTAIYQSDTQAASDAYRAAGGVTLVAHTEGYTPDDLVRLPIEGFEMYNLHANLKLNLAAAVGLLGKLTKPDELMVSDLVLLPVISEDPAYVDTWGTVLARGAKRVTTMGTDAHRNSFPPKLPDGDRIDSWSRMNRWFSNHLLVTPGADGGWDDRSLKDALRGERLYGVFEVLGYAAGFDFHAEEGTTAREMGDEASLAGSPALVVTAPHVRRLDPAADPPEITVRLLRAIEGGWEEVAAGPGDLRHAPTRAGAYRAEVRMKPRHLAAFLHSYQALATQDFAWIYSNAIHVVP